jgi:hypothetical protein
MDQLLIDYEHESIYSSFMLTKVADEKRFPHVETTTKEIFDLFNKSFSINDISLYPGASTEYRYFGNLTNVEAAINYILLKDANNLIEIKQPIYQIKDDGVLDKKNLTKLTVKVQKFIQKINKETGDNLLNFWDIIHEFDKFLLECSGAISFCIPSFDLEDFVVKNDEISSFKEELLSVEPFLAFHQNLILFEKISNEISKNEQNILNLVSKSGARLKSVQLLKAASNTGIPTDIYGKAFSKNIKSSLLDGLTPEEYFITGDSARLALAVRQEAIPKGGELQRKFFFATGILKLAKDVEDCGSEKYYNITIKNKNHLKLLNHRWYFDGELKKIDITDDSLIGRTLQFRSPITCKCEDYLICKKCFGDKQPESINLGSTIGAALSEGIIQSVLRTHHFGGAFIATEDKHLLDIMRRSEFKAPDTIIGRPEDIEYIVEYLNNIYLEEDWEYETIFDGNKTGIKITIHELPFNDDSVKQLNNIVSLIDKNRDASSLIDPTVLYDKLEMVIEQNDILSVYLELIISLLYYDEEGVLYRYTDKELSSQIALKNIIEVLDPKLSIFYNFSNRIISKIYNHKSIGHIDHMYRDLLDNYY